MTSDDALKLHNEDEVHVIKTDIYLHVLDSYLDEDSKTVRILCDDGNTYFADEID